MGKISLSWIELVADDAQERKLVTEEVHAVVACYSHHSAPDEKRRIDDARGRSTAEPQEPQLAS
jgi:hypothetical protein